MAFTATIEGLDELREKLSAGNLDKKLVKAVGTTALQLNNLLNAQVKETYATRRSLNSVLNSKTTSDFKRGLGFIQVGLEYNFVPLLLQEFPQTKTPIQVDSWFKVPNRFGAGKFPNKSGRLRRQKPNTIIAVKVKRNGSPSVIDKAFYGELPRDGKVYLMQRKVNNTWIKEPTPEDLRGIRDDMGILYAPSLSQMAESVYLKDRQVVRFKDNFADHVMRNLELW